jgi:hypothetical protein
MRKLKSHEVGLRGQGNGIGKDDSSATLQIVFSDLLHLLKAKKVPKSAKSQKMFASFLSQVRLLLKA